MTIDQVIKLGDISWWDGVKYIPWYLYIFPIVLLAWGIIVLSKGEEVYEDWEYHRKGERRTLWSSILLVLLIIIGGFSNQSDMIDNWKQKVAYPFIQSLPDEKDEVVFVKIEAKTELRGGWYVFPHYHRLTPLTVSFKSNEGVETYTNWFDASMELSNESKPYIILKRLPKDLGNDVNAGIYNPSLYLPSSYKFTDIK